MLDIILITAKRQELIDSDLEMISRLTGDLCLHGQGKRILIDHYDPKELFQQRIDERYLTAGLSLKGLEASLTRNEPFPGAGKAMLTAMMPATMESDLKTLLEKPGMSENIGKLFPGILANPTPEGLFDSFTRMMTSLNNGEGYKDLRQMVQSGTGINRDQLFDSQDPLSVIDEKRKLIPLPEKDRNNSYSGPEWYDEITREYIQLDMHGYQEDKIATRKGRKQTFNNTVQDSFHVAFAVSCNFYITNDDRSYRKAKRVYEKLRKNTQVMKPEEFVKYYHNYLGIKENLTHWLNLNEIFTNGQFAI